MARVPIGLELYSVRNELAADVRGTIKAVAEMGYEGVEFAGPPQHSAEELKSLLDEFGLVCCGWHTPFNLVQEDTLADTIEFNKILIKSSATKPRLLRRGFVAGNLINKNWLASQSFWRIASQTIHPW